MTVFLKKEKSTLNVFMLELFMLFWNSNFKSLTAGESEISWCCLIFLRAADFENIFKNLSSFIAKFIPRKFPAELTEIALYLRKSPYLTPLNSLIFAYFSVKKCQLQKITHSLKFKNGIPFDIWLVIALVFDRSQNKFS